MYLPAAQAVQGAAPFVCVGPENPALHWHSAPGVQIASGCSEFAGHGVHTVDAASHVQTADAKPEVVLSGHVSHPAILADLYVLMGHRTHILFAYTYPALHVQTLEPPSGESEFAIHSTHGCSPLGPW